MTASIFTAAHAATRNAHTPQFGDIRSYRQVFAVCLRAAHVDARRAAVLPLPCANFYTAEQWNEASRQMEVVYFTSQRQVKTFVEANISKSLSCYAHVSAWRGCASAMQHDLATKNDIAAGSLRDSLQLGVKYRELAAIGACAYVGSLSLAATKQEEAQAEMAKYLLAATLAAQGIEVDLD